MVKKLTALAQEEELANAVRTSAQQIWQAGLGAFAKAQEEGGRVFSKLVQEGTELQKRAEDKVADVAGGVGQLADGVGKQASGSWDKLEQVFEDRVARALGKMGVPSQQDILALNQRIEDLSKLVEKLSGQPAPAAAKKAAPKPVAKPAAAKPAAAKKPAAVKRSVPSA